MKNAHIWLFLGGGKDMSDWAVRKRQLIVVANHTKLNFISVMYSSPSHAEWKTTTISMELLFVVQSQFICSFI